jgi:hypothetical protein
MGCGTCSQTRRHGTLQWTSECSDRTGCGTYFDRGTYCQQVLEPNRVWSSSSRLSSVCECCPCRWREELGRGVPRTQRARRVAAHLVKCALARGSRDNITGGWGPAASSKLANITSGVDKPDNWHLVIFSSTRSHHPLPSCHVARPVHCMYSPCLSGSIDIAVMIVELRHGAALERDIAAEAEGAQAALAAAAAASAAAAAAAKTAAAAVQQPSSPSTTPRPAKATLTSPKAHTSLNLSLDGHIEALSKDVSMLGTWQPAFALCFSFRRDGCKCAPGIWRGLIHW